MFMLVDPVSLAIQSVSENAGTATTSSGLSSATPEALSFVPMGADEDTAAYASAVAAHGGQFLGSTVAGVASRSSFAGTVGVNSAALAVMNALNTVGLTV